MENLKTYWSIIVRRVHFSSFGNVWEHFLSSLYILKYKHLVLPWGSKFMASFCPGHYQNVSRNSPRIWCRVWTSTRSMRQTKITWGKWGPAPTPHNNLEVQKSFLSTSSKEKMEFTGDWVWAWLTPLDEIKRHLSALSPQIVFLLSAYFQRNIRLLCLYFSGLYNAKLEAGRWTNLTSGIMWQILLWFNCCLGGIGGWVWHNNINQNNGHLVYIVFLPVISKQISGLIQMTSKRNKLKTWQLQLAG